MAIDFLPPRLITGHRFGPAKIRIAPCGAGEIGKRSPSPIIIKRTPISRACVVEMCLEGSVCGLGVISSRPLQCFRPSPSFFPSLSGPLRPFSLPHSLPATSFLANL